MIGLPVPDSLEDALGTLAFNKQNKVDDSWVSIFQPYPNTKLAAYCAENGFSDNQNTVCADSFFDNSCLDIDHPEEIKRLQKWWYFFIRYDFDAATIEKLLQIDFDERLGSELQNLRYEFSRNYLYGLQDLNPRLVHDWSRIEADFGIKPTFSRLKTLIRQYSLSYGLVKILVDFDLSGLVSFEDIANAN